LKNQKENFLHRCPGGPGVRRQNTLGWAQHRKPTTQIVAQYRKRGDDNGTDRIRSKCIAANELLEALLAAQDLHSWLQERLPNRLDCHLHKHTHTQKTKTNLRHTAND